MTESIADSADNQRNFKAHMNARRDEAGDSEGVANTKAPDSTCIGLFPCYGANPTGLKLLPATLDADFPHADLKLGEPGSDNLISNATCLIDSGAGVITANLTFIEGLIGMNPTVLVEIYTCKNGE